MFDIREYQDGDATLIEQREVDLRLPIGVPDMVFISKSYKFTYTINNEPAGLVGLYTLFDGVYQAWARPSDRLRGYGRQVVRATRSLLDSYEELLHARQIRTTSPSYAVENIKWLRLIGFKQEAVLRGMLDGGHDLIHFIRWTDLGREHYSHVQAEHAARFSKPVGRV